MQVRSLPPLLLTGAAIVLLMVLPSGNSLPGGVKDANLDYNCGTSCHGTKGAGAPLLSAPKSAEAGSTIDVTVNYRVGEVGKGNRAGVFLLRSSTGSGDQPAQDGWTILSDPDGGKSNYVQVPEEGTDLSLKWSLAAPPSPGRYTLLARVHHGSPGGLALFEDAGAVEVEVTPSKSPLGPVPVINHRPPAEPVEAGRSLALSAWLKDGWRADVEWSVSAGGEKARKAMFNTTDAGPDGWEYTVLLPVPLDADELKYTIYAYGPGGTASKTVPVPVFPKERLTVSDLSASPVPIVEGKPTYLSALVHLSGALRGMPATVIFTIDGKVVGTVSDIIVPPDETRRIAVVWHPARGLYSAGAALLVPGTGESAATDTQFYVELGEEEGVPPSFVPSVSFLTLFGLMAIEMFFVRAGRRE